MKIKTLLCPSCCKKQNWENKDNQKILTELYTIRASIPLTQGKIARGMIKKLIERLDSSK